MVLATAISTAVLVFALTGAAMVHAQDSGTVSLPSTPAPKDCRVEPGTIEDVLARLGITPVPAGEAGEPLGDEAQTFVIPEGSAADEETIEAVTSTANEWIACVNANDFLKILALHSVEEQRELMTEPPVTEEEVEGFKVPVEPRPRDLFASLLAVRDATVLSDGRVGALIETDFPGEPPEGPDVDYVYFIEEEGRWLIDEVVEDLEDQYPPVSTPIAATPVAGMPGAATPTP